MGGLASFHSPVFDRLQFLHTASNQKLDRPCSHLCTMVKKKAFCGCISGGVGARFRSKTTKLVVPFLNIEVNVSSITNYLVTS